MSFFNRVNGTVDDKTDTIFYFSVKQQIDVFFTIFGFMFVGSSFVLSGKLNCPLTKLYFSLLVISFGVIGIFSFILSFIALITCCCENFKCRCPNPNQCLCQGSCTNNPKCDVVPCTGQCICRPLPLGSCQGLCLGKDACSRRPGKLGKLCECQTRLKPRYSCIGLCIIGVAWLVFGIIFLTTSIMSAVEYENFISNCGTMNNTLIT